MAWSLRISWENGQPRASFSHFMWRKPKTRQTNICSFFHNKHLREKTTNLREKTTALSLLRLYQLLFTCLLWKTTRHWLVQSVYQMHSPCCTLGQSIGLNHTLLNLKNCRAWMGPNKTHEITIAQIKLLSIAAPIFGWLSHKSFQADRASLCVRLLVCAFVPIPLNLPFPNSGFFLDIRSKPQGEKN